MEHFSNLHNLLANYKCREFDFNAIKQFLEQDSSSINEVRGVYQPLHIVLRSSYCTKELVKLLLDYGAEVNPSETCSISQLRTALLYVPDTDVLRLLLEGGAVLNRMVLCYALHRRESIEKDIDLLLDYSGKPKSWCSKHNSLLHCYIQCSKTLRASAVEALIKRSADLANRPPKGNSILCDALRHRDCTAPVVKLLLAAGAHISECDNHEKPIHCYVRASYHFRGDVVKLLLEEGLNFNQVLDGGNALLHLALRNCKYEVAALEVLLENKDVDVNMKNATCGSSPLICALNNHHNWIKPEAIKLLVKKGASMDVAAKGGCIPLHYAVRNFADASISLVKVLVDLGSPINVPNDFGMTPIEFAFRNSECSVIKLLLTAGATFSAYTGILMLTMSLGASEHMYGQQIRSLQLLLKHTILEDRSYGFYDRVVKSISNRSETLHQLLRVDCFECEQECVAEVDRMGRISISQSLTLLDFAAHYPCAKLPNVKYREYDFDELLRILVNNEFPLYFEIICSKVKRFDLGLELDKLLNYVSISSYDPTCADTKGIKLKGPCVIHIASFLPENDFMNFIIALTSQCH